jgi:hypothetical protein
MEQVARTDCRRDFENIYGKLPKIAPKRPVRKMKSDGKSYATVILTSGGAIGEGEVIPALFSSEDLAKSEFARRWSCHKLEAWMRPPTLVHLHDGNPYYQQDYYFVIAEPWVLDGGMAIYD